MTASSHEIALPSNKQLDTGVGVSRQPCRLIEIVARVAHGLWASPLKVPAELASRARVHPRTAERWLSLRTGMSDDALGALLQSDEGLIFLDAMMAQANPVPMWWQDFRAAVEREQINRQLSELRRQLKARDQRAK